MSQNIFIQYIVWHFKEAPKKILHIWKNYLKFYSYFFSIPLLLKTYFSPWKRISWVKGRGFSIKRFLETFLSNLFSRCVGAIMRTFLILIGIGAEIMVLIIGGVFLILWIFAPILIVIVFGVGIKFLF